MLLLLLVVVVVSLEYPLKIHYLVIIIFFGKQHLRAFRVHRVPEESSLLELLVIFLLVMPVEDVEALHEVVVEGLQAA